MRRDADAALCTWRDNRSSVGATRAPTATARRMRQNQHRLRGAGGAPLLARREATRGAEPGVMAPRASAARAATNPRASTAGSWEARGASNHLSTTQLDRRGWFSLSSANDLQKKTSESHHYSKQDGGVIEIPIWREMMPFLFIQIDRPCSSDRDRNCLACDQVRRLREGAAPPRHSESPRKNIPPWQRANKSVR